VGRRFITSAERNPLPDQLVHPFFSGISNLLKPGSTLSGREAAVQSLQALVPRQELRTALWNQDIILSRLVSIFIVENIPLWGYSH
jgi:hypothetical protein